jgi:NADPH:quinone reductase-like Zn-dependent oxidoreductase
MNAVVMRGFGSPDVLRYETVADLRPATDEVLVSVRAATVTAGDCELRSLDVPLSFRLPFWVYGTVFRRDGWILGQEVAGAVAAVGSDVTDYAVGDRVFAATRFRFGAHAEYVALPESSPIVPVPGSLSYERAATIPTGGANALHALRAGEVGAGDRVLVNGAGGSIGTYAVQLAADRDAEVMAVDAGEKLPLLRELGADRVVDYRVTDFAATGEAYDVIVDVVGAAPLSRGLDALRPGGRYVVGNPTVATALRAAWTSATTDRRVVVSPADYDAADLAALAERVVDGEIRSVVDRRYPLAEAAAAHRYVESGAKRGHVVLAVAADGA